VISPYEVIDKHSVDVLRSYMCRASAGEDVNFSWDELIVAERRVKIMWNLHKLLLNLSIEVGQNPFELDKEITLSLCSLEEKYILSYLQSAIKEITLRMENYELDKVPELIDDLFLEISRTYIQMVREKSSVGSSEEKEVVLYVLAHVLFEGLKVAQIVMPYASEAMYLNLKQAYDLEEESISHFMWPKADEKLVDEKLVASMGVVSSVIQSGLNAREKAKLGLRWPIKELIVVSLDSEVISSVESLRDILKAQLNVKDISILSSLPGVKESVKPNYRTLGPKFQKQSSEVITKLTVTSSEAILTNLNSKGVHEVVLDSGETVTVVRADFEISREVPVGFSEAEFKDGYVYLNLERNLELDAEGYAREIMRYMQNARKKSGFQKADQIFLHVTCPGDLGEAVSVWSDSIAAKVGASKVYVGSLEFPRAFKEQETFSVKGKEFSVGYEKV